VRDIHEDGIVQAPRLVGRTTVGTRTGFLQTWLDGESPESGAFPDTRQVHQQLGRFLAQMHLRRYDRYGTLVDQPLHPHEFVARMNASMRTTIHRYWSHRPDVSDWFDRHARHLNPDVFSGHIAPIMPDIGGNQFVYRDGALAGVVDLDSYVVGPRELELAGVEMCLTRPDDFRRGYESVLPLPRFAAFRAYCRFWVLVGEAAGDPDIEKFLTSDAHFD
jgi:Ser/Thr protein kinase RdoA (MazF antagonist)